MKARDLVAQTPASYKQIANWIEAGVKIGKKSKGPGYHREFDDVDVLVVRVLAGLSPLMGSGYRVPSAKSVMKKVATQIRREPSIAARELIFISTTGIITEEPNGGWVVAV